MADCEAHLQDVNYLQREMAYRAVLCELVRYPHFPVSNPAPVETTRVRVCSIGPEEHSMGLCCICLDLLKNEELVYGCPQHLACKNCLKIYLTMKISEGRLALPCVGDYHCSHRFSNTMLEQIVEPRVLALYVSNRANAKEWIRCGRCGNSNLELNRLSSILHSPYGYSSVRCRSCSAISCLYCHELVSTPRRYLPWNGFFHGAGTRNHVCTSTEWQSIAAFAQDPSNETKPCPHCFKLTHRFEGCLHMTCLAPDCGGKYCWECLGKITHSAAECEAARAPVKTRTLGALKTSFAVSGSLARGLVKTTGQIVMFPKLLLEAYRDRIVYREILFNAEMLRSGMNLFVTSVREDVHDDDWGADVHALTFDRNYTDVAANIFVTRASSQFHEGRIVSNAQGHYCFRAYSCFPTSGLLVTVHSHQPSELCEFLEPSQRGGRQIEEKDYRFWIEMNVDTSDFDQTERVIKRACINRVARLGHPGVLGET